MLLSAMLSPHLFIFFFTFSWINWSFLFPNNYVFSFPFFSGLVSIHFDFNDILASVIKILSFSFFFVAQHLKFQPNITLSIHFLLYSEESVVRFYYKLKILKIIFLNNLLHIQSLPTFSSHFVSHFYLVLFSSPPPLQNQFSRKIYLYSSSLFLLARLSLNTFFTYFYTHHFQKYYSKVIKRLPYIKSSEHFSICKLFFLLVTLRHQLFSFLKHFLFGFHDKSSLSQNFCSYLLVILFYVAFNLTSSHYCLSSHSLSWVNYLCTFRICYKNAQMIALHLSLAPPLSPLTDCQMRNIPGIFRSISVSIYLQLTQNLPQYRLFLVFSIVNHTFTFNLHKAKIYTSSLTK